MASHSAGLIREFCNRTIVLNNGKGTVYDDIDEGLSVYEAL